tara:strand:+ start:2044 stop:3459 length:1416 start_codon:yes stop_codon:yes gene_type:complete
MFRLEKVFQNDDSAYILYVNIIKTLIIFFSFYMFSILENNTIYDLFNFTIFKNSKFFYVSIFVSLIFFFLSFIFKEFSVYKKNFLSFLKEDALNLIISILITFSLFFIVSNNLELDIEFIYLIFFLNINLFLSKLYFNYLHTKLIDKNIIQKNIMLIGTYDQIQKILKENFDKIYVFKCCIVLDRKNYEEKLLKSVFKIPIFKNTEDIRAILEYHALGQVWLLKTDEINVNKSLEGILKFSVDILIVDLNERPNLNSTKLLSNKYNFEHYEISRFHGINLFLKILIDKFFSAIFLILSTPLLLLSSIAIYLEDGFPIIFTQNRTGWDGRRFKIYKLRTLKKESFDKTVQVGKNDKRVLKFGKFIRRYSIDELPQFYNVFIGDMSIVGPRPHMVEHDIKYSNLFDSFLKRHKCNPGLTGWAQVNGLRGATPTPDIMKKRMDYDLWYLNNWTVFLDIYIILKTFYAIIKFKGE